MSGGALTLLQFATGVFFTTTGYRKLFTPDGRENVTGVFRRIGKPWALWPTMLGEFLGGIALLTDILPRFAAAGLLAIMLGAYTLVIFPPIWDKDRGQWSKLLSNALCTPEAQLILILTTLVIGG